MSDHQRHTEFLRQCILYEESAGRQELDEGIIRIQRDARCVRRAAWLMAIMIALVLAVVAYGTVLVDNFPNDAPPFVVNLIYALGLGSLISLLAFFVLGLVYRWKLDRRREQCRELVARLLESRLGKPAAISLRDNRAGAEGAHRIREPVEAARASLTGRMEQGGNS